MGLQLSDSVENTGKWSKCWLPAFSPFPTVFYKDVFFRIIKSWNCVEKSLNLKNLFWVYPSFFPRFDDKPR